VRRERVRAKRRFSCDFGDFPTEKVGRKKHLVVVLAPNAGYSTSNKRVYGVCGEIAVKLEKTLPLLAA
jgi:hypothetical protein